MSLPRLLCVDDSDAILALERAMLSGHYQITTASNGREALEKLAQVKPAAMLLDLSMPEMDGDEVLARVRKAEGLRHLPVVIISSEKSRAQECLGQGADAFVAKPFRADELLAIVERVLEDARKREREGGLAVLGVSVGEVRLCLPLEAVRAVVLQPATLPLAGGPDFLRDYFDFHGAPVCVLELGTRLGVPEEARAVRHERKLVILRREVTASECLLALAVDRVTDPEEIAPANVDRREVIGGAEHGSFGGGLMAMVRTQQEGLVPVLDPAVFFDRALLQELDAVLGSTQVART